MFSINVLDDNLDFTNAASLANDDDSVRRMSPSSASIGGGDVGINSSGRSEAAQESEGKEGNADGGCTGT